jgi:hypothetical protein
MFSAHRPHTLRATTVESVQHLPPEILLAIVQTYRSDQDLVFLWTVLRNANHTFRDLVDEWVRRRHLHTMMIVPTSIILNLTPSSDPQLRYACPFEHLAPSDSSRAVFRIAPDAPQLFRFQVGLALESARARYPMNQNQSPEAEPDPSEISSNVAEDQHVDPSAFVILRRLANDTELVGWTVDSEAMQLELDWRETIGKLIWEEKLRGALTKSWVSQNCSHLVGNASQIPSTLRSPLTALIKSLANGICRFTACSSQRIQEGGAEQGAFSDPSYHADCTHDSWRSGRKLYDLAYKANSASKTRASTIG